MAWLAAPEPLANNAEWMAGFPRWTLSSILGASERSQMAARLETFGDSGRKGESMATNLEEIRGQRVYDSAFLNFLANRPKPLAPCLPPGCRQVAGWAPGLKAQRGYPAIILPVLAEAVRRKERELTTPCVKTPARAATDPTRPRLRGLFSRFKKQPRLAEPALTEPECRKYQVTLDLTNQVFNLKLLGSDIGKAFESNLFPSFAEADAEASKFAPAAALALKAKLFDDGLYACVEMATDMGLGRFPSRKEFLLHILKALGGDSNRTAAALLTAAARLGGQDPQVPADVARRAGELQSEFLADELRSKVLGFYTWSEELTRIFRSDRMLQAEIDEQEARALAAALSCDEKLLQAYTSTLSLMEKLTNPLAVADLRDSARALKEGRTPSFPQPHATMAFFPPSISHETDLVKKLYGDQPIPEGFNLADEIIKRLREGTLDVKPKPNSGWYDYQTYALEPLAVPERMPECAHLKLDESYRKELVGLFKALLSLTRETHIKQAATLVAGVPGGYPDSKEMLYVFPDLTLEPLPTYYLRRARSYHFVREVLEQAFGAEGLQKLRRMTADGTVNLPLGEETRLMQAIFHGAYLQVCAEIGMAVHDDPDLANCEGAHGDPAVFRTWQGFVSRDPDLNSDIRTMVPVFHDPVRGRTKVWLVLGIITKPLIVSYATPPVIKEIKDPDGRLVRPDDMDVRFLSDNWEGASIATAEVYVTRLLNRNEFRQHCDRHKTYEAIISRLE